MDKKKVVTYLIPAVILIGGFLLMMLFSSFKEEEVPRKPVPKTKIVEARVVDLGSVESKITGYGRLKSAQPVVLISEVAGELMKGSVPFLPGQNFNKGDLLIKVDDRQVKLNLSSTKSDMLNALAGALPEIKLDFPGEYDKWQNYFNSISFDKDVPEMPEPANQKIKLYLTRFNVYKLYFTIRDLEILLDKHYFYAPFSGSIISTELRTGSTARAGTRLGEIINLTNMEVETPIAAKDLQWIDYSKPVTLTSSELSGEWQGRIARTGKTIDDATQTVPVYITVYPRDLKQLYNGVFLKANIPGKKIESGVVIPRKAIYGEKYVYLVNNGKLEYREVEIAREQTNTMIISGGINDKDTLVTDVLQGVAEGMPAKAKLNGVH